MPGVLPFAAVTPDDETRVGGKAFALARLAAAGLPVPPGFVLPADADLDEEAIQDAYRDLCGGPVAVRSSATAEDGAGASFAGQQDTVLGVEGGDAVLAAVRRVRASLHSARAVAYRRQQGVPDAGLGMAVVVQKLVPADTAGVLFTRDPLAPDAGTMLVEAAWGLGEAVVSGRVEPDRFTLEVDTGATLARAAGRKTVRVTAAGEEPVPPAEQSAFCLGDGELSRLADLGRRVEAFAGGPRDIEWAFAGGELYLLQARPITASGGELGRVRAEVVAELKSKADPAGTVWVRFNLSEVLPEPTPMTWAVVGRLLAADGGFGAMNRDLGANPDPALGSDGAFDLVAGRPMLNLSKLPRMQFAKPPLRYPFAALKADPRQALDPKPVLDPWAAGLFGLPGLLWRVTKMAAAARRGAAAFPERFRRDIAPPFAAAARSALGQDWAKLDPPGVLRVFEEWVVRTLIDFARESLKATVYADAAWQTLVAGLTPKHGAEEAKRKVAALAVGAKPAAEANLAAALGDLAAGTLGKAEFLRRFGHRGANEMELSAPRWAEEPAAVTGSRGQPPPAADLDPLGAELRTLLGLREEAKHYLLMGYAVIRRALVELDRRFALNGGVFFLLPAELRELLGGADLSPRIAGRRKRRRAELSLPVPPVLFSDDLDAVGRQEPAPEGATVLHGVPLSAGVAEGPALVLTDPTTDAGADGFVLVCPSTDPAWVPLFARAKALVMETGGVLSHGAIVAREFGLPAVAGLPGAVRRLRTGQRLRVDGAAGTVTSLEQSPK